MTQLNLTADQKAKLAELRSHHHPDGGTHHHHHPDGGTWHHHGDGGPHHHHSPEATASWLSSYLGLSGEQEQTLLNYLQSHQEGDPSTTPAPAAS
jgi:hypothetical protein